MTAVPSSTWFTASPEWGWYIAVYFFLGGLAGGCYFLAAAIDLIGRREDRPLARLGYYVAFPCVAISGLLLTLDLGRPLRFWHMLIESNTYRPMFKAWSPMSVGAWALLVFGGFSFLSLLDALGEEIDRPAFPRFRASPLLRRAIAAIGAVLGLYVAGYTGVLLAVTNRPIWADTRLLGMLFIFSAASTSAALIVFLAQRTALTLPGIADMHRMEGWAIVMEFVALIALIVSLGPVLRAWLNVWGVLLVIVVVLGMITPLVLSWRGADRVRLSVETVSAVCVLLAGLLLRVVIVFSSGAV